MTQTMRRKVCFSLLLGVALTLSEGAFAQKATKFTVTNLMRIVLTQPYVNCLRLATKGEIDNMVATKGFRDNWNGQGVNYISERLALEDMHPANVFVDTITDSTFGSYRFFASKALRDGAQELKEL